MHHFSQISHLLQIVWDKSFWTYHRKTSIVWYTSHILYWHQISSPYPKPPSSLPLVYCHVSCCSWSLGLTFASLPCIVCSYQNSQADSYKSNFVTLWFKAVQGLVTLLTVKSSLHYVSQTSSLPLCTHQLLHSLLFTPLQPPALTFARHTGLLLRWS